jgi:hypothetical protein
VQSKFLKVGDNLINLEFVRAAEYAPDGRLQIFLSEERGAGLVLKFSGEEARAAWAALNDPSKVPIIHAEISSPEIGPPPGSDGRA